MHPDHLNSRPNAQRPCLERRHDERLKVDLLINRFVNGYPYLCRVTDISRSGMRIVPMREPGEPPRFMGLQFQLPGSDQIISASGEAVSVGGGDGTPVGVRFTRLPTSAATLIDDLVGSVTVAGDGG